MKTETKEPQQDFMNRVVDFLPVIERLFSSKPGFGITITENDLLKLTPEEFNNVWNAIGTCLYNRRKKEGEVCQQSKLNPQ